MGAWIGQRKQSVFNAIVIVLEYSTLGRRYRSDAGRGSQEPGKRGESWGETAAGRVERTVNQLRLYRSGRYADGRRFAGLPEEPGWWSPAMYDFRPLGF